MSKKSVHRLTLVLALTIAGVLLGNLFFGGSVLQGDSSHDFGIVSIPRPSSTLEHTFRLTNNTQHALRLTDAVPSCGCTTANWPKESVQPGDIFLIPVTLNMQRSQYRSSTVRLEFASGEVEVLLIEGTGRFEQPMQCLPPTVRVVPDDEEGNVCVLSLEWFQDTTPPELTFETPTNITITADSWLKSKKGNPNKSTPDKWTSRLRVVLKGVLETGDAFVVNLEGAPPLHVPLQQTEFIERPGILNGGRK
ncbi:MAG: DUF1573 domain-containing protein [Phycisphaerae bacterium]|nr:DUF1573 domain-containing protein [Phycisphaerae bacterium]